MMKVKSGYARLILPRQKLLTASGACVCVCLGFEGDRFLTSDSLQGLGRCLSDLVNELLSGLFSPHGLTKNKL